MIVKTKKTMFPAITYDIHKIRDNKYILTADDMIISVRSSFSECDMILSNKTKGVE